MNVSGILLIFAILVVGEQGRAIESSLHDLQKLIRARSTTELERNRSDRSHLQRARLVCNEQLKAARVPGHCFLVIHLETKLALITETRANEERAWLDRLCLSRARTSNDRRELETASHSESTPDACRRAAKMRFDDLRYSDQVDRPEKVFGRRSRSARF